MIKILIVDDEKSTADSLATFLKAKPQVEALTASGVAEALSLIKAHKPQILLVDLKLEGNGSGFDVIKHAKEITPDSVIIVITGLADEYLQTRSHMLEAEYFLQKPIKLEDVDKLIEKIMKKQSRGN